MNIESNKALSSINQKKALVFFVRKKLFKPIYIGKIKKFTGYQTFMWIRSNGYESFDIDISMTNGESTIILVQKERFYILAENECKKTINLDIDKGWYKLRLIGKDASLKFTIKRQSK